MHAPLSGVGTTPVTLILAIPSRRIHPSITPPSISSRLLCHLSIIENVWQLIFRAKVLSGRPWVRRAIYPLSSWLYFHSTIVELYYCKKERKGERKKGKRREKERRKREGKERGKEGRCNFDYY